jgi:DNA mismatch endonuclease, patch repair protein
MDVHDQKTRSFNMSRIKGKDTKPEIKVRRFCHAAGLRFRLHRKDLQGKPDLVFPKLKIVLFVHGCYWHSHECKYGRVTPKTNAEFWTEKRKGTIARDRKNKRYLIESGWKVLILWECQIKDDDYLLNFITKNLVTQVYH